MLVSGDAGVGKTSLLAEAARRADDDGLLVLLGRCVDLGTGALPYLPFAEALSQLVRAGESAGSAEAGAESNGPAARAAAVVRQVAQERPGLARIAGRSGRPPAERAPGDAGLDRLALFEAVAHVLGRLGDEVAPLLLVIEDLHWADASTRDLIRFLLARLGTDRLLVVASYRGDDLHRRHPLRPLIGELVRLPQVERMELLPFVDSELADFLTGLHGARLPDEQLQQITSRSAGNAYYAEELLAAGLGDQLPAALADVLLDRLEQLTPAGQRLVRMASVLGSARIDDWLLRGAVRDLAAGPGVEDADGRAPTDGDPGMEIEHAVREALAHQLLVPDGPDRYAFRHALLQEAVYTDLLPGERVRRHASVAHRLAELTQSDDRRGNRLAAELARHSLAAHDLPLALTASLRAASEAARASAPTEAMAHYEQALQLWDAVAADRRPEGRNQVEIGVVASNAAADAGLHERALHLAEAALDEALCRTAQFGPAEVAQARAAVALHLYAVERPTEARDLARQVISDLGQEPPSAARVLARLLEARVDLSFSEAEAALAVIPAALAEAETLGLLGSAAELLTTRAVALGMVGSPTEAEQWDVARAAAERAGDQAAMIRVLYNIAIDRLDSGDLAGGAVSLSEAARLADATGLASSLYGAQSRSLLITTYWQLGDADAALAVVDPGEGSESDRLTATLVRRLRIFELPVLAARDPEQVLTADQWLVIGDNSWHRQVLNTARAEALLWLGRWAESARAADLALSFLDVTSEPYPLAGIAIGVTAVAAYADATAHARERGDHDEERRLIDAAARFVEDGRERGRRGRPRRGVMGPEGRAWLARLEVEAVRLTGDDGESAWAEVATAFDGVCLIEVARARWRRAQLLVRAGRRDEARAEAAAAHEAAVQLGAQPLVAALDELGRRARFEVARPVGSDLLTPRERDVMALVAQGLTNRAIGEQLFISEKTASVHVSNVLAKLGASGRAEAVAIIGRRGLID